MNRDTKAWLPVVVALTLFAVGSFATGVYVKGQQITSDQASGSNGLAFTVNGARADLGTGGNDYWVSDGTTISSPGPVTVAALHSTSTLTVGQITLSGGVGTATVAAGAICVCTDSSSVLAAQCTVSSTTLTATVTGGTTNVVNYLCL